MCVLKNVLFMHVTCFPFFVVGLRCFLFRDHFVMFRLLLAALSANRSCNAGLNSGAKLAVLVIVLNIPNLPGPLWEVLLDFTLDY